MSWDVGKCEIAGADELDGRSTEHGVVFFTDKAGIFYGFLYDVMDVLEE
jgi:hypothetical protein